MWNIGEPGGPSGPFYSVIKPTGQSIALQIPDREMAERIAMLPSMSKIVHSQGRLHLMVSGIIVATEGDAVRDGNVVGTVWGKENLEQVASMINSGECGTR